MCLFTQHLGHLLVVESDCSLVNHVRRSPNLEITNGVFTCGSKHFCSQERGGDGRPLYTDAMESSCVGAGCEGCCSHTELLNSMSKEWNRVSHQRYAVHRVTHQMQSHSLDVRVRRADGEDPWCKGKSSHTALS